MINLLKETIEKLNQNNKKEEDVICVYCKISSWNMDEKDKEYKTTFELFKKYADFSYDDGYGGNEILLGLKIIGNDFWLERGEYDGSEWWNYKTFPNVENAEFVDSENMIKKMICSEYFDEN